MITAGEIVGVAGGLADNLRAPVSAAIVENINVAVLVADDDDGLAAHKRGEEIAGRLHLAFMADEQPGAAEQSLHFQFEYVRIGVNPAMDARRFNQVANVMGVHNCSPCRNCPAAKANLTKAGPGG